jgi:Flp pilus assembly protein TadG
MTLQDQYAETTNPALQARVQMACSSAAQAISTEPTDTANHQNRVNLAQQVARSPDQFKLPFTSMLCAEGITSQSTDDEINSMVSAVWDTMAGPPMPPPALTG